MKHIPDIQIKNAAPHIFRRPFLFVEPNTRLLQIATFLAIGSQIYVDGLVVMSDNDKGQRTSPIGRISSKHIISNILESNYPDCLDTKALQIMDSTVGALEMDSTLNSVLEIFDRTRFAFVPIVANRGNERSGEIDSSPMVMIAALAIRDILPVIAKANLSIPIKKISSRLVSVDGNTSIRNALSYMIRTGIRNIGINEEMSIHDDVSGDSVGINEDGGNSKPLRIINDRKILEFLFSHNGRESLRKTGTTGLGDISIINHLDIISIAQVKSNTTVSKAAELLMDIRNPCLILKNNEKEEAEHNYIVTPWDVVMKTLKSDSPPMNTN
jgi:predicted transcriptional regulator